MPEVDLLTAARGVGNSYGANESSVQSWNSAVLADVDFTIGTPFKSTNHSAILAFDLQSVIPVGSVINRAELHLHNITDMGVTGTIMDFRFLEPAPSHDFGSTQTLYAHYQSYGAVWVNGTQIHFQQGATTDFLPFGNTFGVDSGGIGFTMSGTGEVTLNTISLNLRRGSTLRPGNVWIAVHRKRLAPNGLWTVDENEHVAISNTRTYDSIATVITQEQFTFPADTTLMGGDEYVAMVHWDLPDPLDRIDTLWIRYGTGALGHSSNQAFAERGNTPGECGILVGGGHKQIFTAWKTITGGEETLVTTPSFLMSPTNTELVFGKGVVSLGADVDFDVHTQLASDNGRPLVFTIEFGGTTRVWNSSNAAIEERRPFLRVNYTPPPKPPDLSTPSETSIANAALVCLGHRRIDSLDENSPAARRLKDRFEEVRDEVLRSHPWDFATKRAELAPDADPPIWGFANSFTMPTDLIRLNEVDTADTQLPHRVHGRKILTSIPAPLQIVYVARVEDPQQMDPLFRQYWAVALAFDVCEAITGDSDKLAQVFEKLQSIRREAMAANGQERQPADVTFSDFHRARGREDKSR